MKRLEDLTKKQRKEWELNNPLWSPYAMHRFNGGENSVKYIILHNTKEEIAEWLKKATTTYFDTSCAPYFCTVFEYNRLHEYIAGNYTQLLKFMKPEELSEGAINND